MISQFKSPRIDIVFDQYFTPSIKDCERLRRNETTSTVSIGPNQIRHHNFAGELKNTQFKEALVKFFIDHWANDNMYPFIGNKTIYISFDKCYSYHVVNNQVIRSIEESLSCDEHEAGCDYTPAFFRKGKLRPFKLLEKSVEYQLACQEIITDDDDELELIFATLEKIICHMYGVPNSSNVNDVRFYLFSKTYQSKELDDNFEKKCRSFDSSSLPPCKAELYQHLLRVRYVTKFWRNAHLKNPSSLLPLASGWIVNDDKYNFVWFAGEQFPSSELLTLS
ncbi:uncharacterized protein TNCV_2910541 [Trichonephila clavipes]|nr:uncharacterized protein TNCV_2910541 [Trichonephila clavipes]